jgi:hypothetical protein
MFEFPHDHELVLIRRELLTILDQYDNVFPDAVALSQFRACVSSATGQPPRVCFPTDLETRE